MKQVWWLLAGWEQQRASLVAYFLQGKSRHSWRACLEVNSVAKLQRYSSKKHHWWLWHLFSSFSRVHIFLSEVSEGVHSIPLYFINTDCLLCTVYNLPDSCSACHPWIYTVTHISRLSQNMSVKLKPGLWLGKHGTLEMWDGDIWVDSLKDFTP